MGVNRHHDTILNKALEHSEDCCYYIYNLKKDRNVGKSRSS